MYYQIFSKLLYNFCMTNLIEIKNVKMKFPVKSSFTNSKKEFIYALNDVSLDIRQGEILGLVGESGCGKSTLGKCILKLYSNFSGKILIVRYYRRSDALLFKKTPNLSCYIHKSRLPLQQTKSAQAPHYLYFSSISAWIYKEKS